MEWSPRRRSSSDGADRAGLLPRGARHHPKQSARPSTRQRTAFHTTNRRQRPMRLADTQNGYGWMSIALHWTTAIIVLVMWFIGNSIAVSHGVDQDKLIRLHTTIAILAYALVWLRVLWRVFNCHPGPLPK